MASAARTTGLLAFRATLFLSGAALVFACAQGGRDAFDTNDAENTEAPNEPASPSTPMPGRPDAGKGGASDPGFSDAGDAGKDSGGKPDAGGPTDSGAGVVDAGSCAKVAPSNACGLVPQCGCSANQTCDVTDLATGAVACVGSGGGNLGGACTATSQCSKGLTCLYGACRPYCNNPNGQCNGQNLGFCFAPEKSGGGTTPNLAVCTVRCDPRNPAALCGSNTCLWFAADNDSDCNVPGTKGLYDTCSSVTDCKAGLACAKHPLFGNECETWCRIGQSDCAAFEACTDVYGAKAPVVGGVKLGLCQ